MVDWLPEDHLVWFVIEAVRRLDTSAFHRRTRLGGVGRRGYDPDMLLTLLVYAMVWGQRSSRQIERLCHSDVAYRIICAQDVPDHTVLAEFRRVHEAELAQLFTQVLVLCAELGMVRLGVVAFDGVKIAANAAKDANRGEAALRRLAQQHLAAAAAADTAEDALFGVGMRGDELPRTLHDRTRRGERIGQALAQIADRKAATAGQSAGQAAVAEAYQQAVSAGKAPRGAVPNAVDPVAVAKARWERERATAQARLTAWQAKADAAAAAGQPLPGRRPRPVDQHHRVRRTRAAYDKAMAESADTEPAAAAHGNTSHDQDDGPRANLTDPDSRLLKTRTGWVQGYNCQTATSEDQFIIHARATRDSNDLHQFQPTADAVTTLAAHLSTHTGRTNLVVGTMLGDAGYDSHHNLTTPGPDRLIANATRRDLRTRATTNPATGNPPPDASPRQAMDHRLRTPDGHALYTRRSPIAETPHAWLKDRRGLRQFTRRGLPAAHSELRFAAAVTNLLRLHTLGITTRHLRQP
jgi:transposase